MSALTLILQAVAYNDPAANSNPSQLPISWKRVMSNLPFENPSTQSMALDPNSSATIVDGTRALGIDGTTEFSLASSPLDPSRYRVTWTGGTDPEFRVDRGVFTDSIQLTLTVNPNLTLTVEAGSGTPFTGVQVGDVVFVPGVSTGDVASEFNALNEGYWTVLTKTSTILSLSRVAGSVFSGVSEVVTPSDDAFFQVFSAAGVQAGDTVDITAGFATSARHSYDIVAANPLWIEFQASAPLGAESAITPGASGFVIYTSSKRFLMIETDQGIALRLNGSTDNSNRIDPIIPGDPNYIGPYIKVGTAWKVEIVNLSSVRANVVVASAE